MVDYELRVVGPDGEDIAGQEADEAPAAFGRLFTEVCRNIVAGELRLQGDVPAGMYAGVRFDGPGDLAADARRLTDGALDYLGGGAKGTWMDDTFPDVMGRRRIASLVLGLAQALGGRSLVHGPEGSSTVFGDIDAVRVTGIAQGSARASNGGLMGLVVRDPSHRGRWALDRGGTRVPLTFRPGTSEYEVEGYSEAGPVIVTGTVIRDDSGAVTEIRAIENCYTFPGVVFLRAIGEGRDLGLVSPLMADVSYYAKGRRWYLRCPDLGLESSDATWDGCVSSFHDAFLDLWQAHAEGRAEPNARIRGMLDSMHPLPAE